MEKGLRVELCKTTSGQIMAEAKCDMQRVVFPIELWSTAHQDLLPVWQLLRVPKDTHDRYGI